MPLKWIEALRLCGLQVASIAAHLDRNADGFIDYEEFLDGFKVCIGGDGTPPQL